MKRIGALCAVVICLLLCRAASAAGGIPIDKDHFPDKTFRNYVLKNFDTNQDKTLSTQEAAAAVLKMD